MSAMTFHPLADIFPNMAHAEFESLKADIKQHGVREAVWLYDGKILDGRHRWRACQELGIKCPTRVYDGDDPAAFVVSLNMKRRHMNESQRAMVAAKLANLEHGQRKSDRSIDLSQNDAGELLNVSGPSVRRATKVRKEGAPELVQAVESGKISVFAGSKIASIPSKATQREVVAAAEKNGHARLSPKTYEASAQPTARQKDNAHNYAQDAINCLRKIGKDNPLRAAAFKIVKKWIKDNP